MCVCGCILNRALHNFLIAHPSWPAAGIKRAHLLDARTDGGLLLELYTRDGADGGTMISTDFYEGEGDFMSLDRKGSDLWVRDACVSLGGSALSHISPHRAPSPHIPTLMPPISSH